MSDPSPPPPSRWKRLRAWIRRRLRAMLSSALRGAAYASGAGIVGLMFWWIQHQL
ncbi:hypothetical protein ACFT4A_34280 [Streptomyces sp. NPDC057099]|uniref:hypothetical protein n=1 Tax=Streptomyces sp. NPDC057099 TaxID=3346019 RepID=UPI00363A1BAD